MITSTKIRIYPSDDQKVTINKFFGCARWLWNNSLAETQKAYKETGKGLGQFALNKRLPALKEEFPWLADTHSQVLQAVCLNMSRAFINFFERRANYPKFKTKRSKQSIQYPQGVRLVSERKIYLPKIGEVKAAVHREIAGEIKTVTVSRSVSGKFFASILVEDKTTPPAASFEGQIVGIDLGLTHLAVTSRGAKFENPKHLAKATKNLRRKQQKLSRKVQGSNSRNKARIIVAKVHERIANTRKDFLHKLSRRLVDENQVIAIESLSVKELMKRHCVARSISDAGWGLFSSFLEYKSARVGKGFVKVDRFFPSSKLCSNCLRAKEHLSLDARSWLCVHCGTRHDRDINAAKNIRLEAQRMIAAGIAGTANGGKVSRGKGRRSSVLAPAVEVGSPSFV